MAAVALTTRPLWFPSEPAIMPVEPETPPRLVAASDGQHQAATAGHLMLEFERLNQPDALRAALKQAGEAMQSNPASEEAWFVLGRGHDALGDYPKARDTYARALSLNPAAAEAYRLTGQTWLPEGQLEQALPWLTEAHKGNPDDLEIAADLLQLAHSLEDYPAAEYWSEWIERRVTSQSSALAALAVHHYLTGNFRTAIQYSNISQRLGLDTDWQSDAIFTRIKRDEAIATGQFSAAIALISKQQPGLLTQPPEIVPGNVAQAVDLAYLKGLAGQKAAATRLLEAVLEAYAQPMFTEGSARASVLPARAEALALMGHTDAAMAELRRIVEEGWRVMWRWETELNANFHTLREDPAFNSLVLQLESDVNGQRSRIARTESRQVPYAGLAAADPGNRP